MPSPFPCSPVIRECSWKKTQIEKKNTVPWFSLEAVLQANGVTGSELKEVIKKQLENAPKKRKGGEKTQMIKNDRINTPMLIKIWNCIVGIIFYGLILGLHEFIFSYAKNSAVSASFKKIN